MKIGYLYLVDSWLARLNEFLPGVFAQFGHTSVPLHALDPAVFIEQLQREQPDLIFMHGPLAGLDTILSLLEHYRVPYTGSSLETLKLTRNRSLCRRLLDYYDLPVNAWQDMEAPDEPLSEDFLHPTEPGWLRGRMQITWQYRHQEPPPLPDDVRPSYTPLKLTDLRDLLERLFPLAASMDMPQRILVEPLLYGRDFDVVVLGNQQVGDGSHVYAGETPPGLTVLPILEWIHQEPQRPYTGSTRYTQSICPADISAEQAEELRLRAVAAYRVTGCRDYGVVRFTRTSDNRLYITDVIPEPNLYDEPLLPWRRENTVVPAATAAGIEYPALIERILTLAVERHRLT